MDGNNVSKWLEEFNADDFSPLIFNDLDLSKKENAEKYLLYGLFLRAKRQKDFDFSVCKESLSIVANFIEVEVSQ